MVCKQDVDEDRTEIQCERTRNVSGIRLDVIFSTVPVGTEIQSIYGPHSIVRDKDTERRARMTHKMDTEATRVRLRVDIHSREEERSSRRTIEKTDSKEERQDRQDNGNDKQ